MKMDLATISKIVNGKEILNNISINSISTDTRKLSQGSLFIAIVGKNFDANDFIEVAKERGAVAAIVSKPVKTDLPVIQVDDTRMALGKIAAFWRSQFHMPLLALTGSCGKTTSKAMLAHILEQQGNVLSTQGTFNNDIGLPLTLFQLNEKHEYAVIELGANHFNEIDYLTKIAKPDVAAITNIGAAHLEGFGDLAGVAKGKSEIFNGLAKDGIAVLNRDDAFYEYISGRAKAFQQITFAINQPADVMATDINIDKDSYASFNLNIADKQISTQLKVMGKHNIYNALCAAAMATTQKVPLKAIKAGLENFIPVGKRLAKHFGINQTIIIDDSYNAIPNAIYQALDILVNYQGKKIFVFGGMAELGEHVESEHIQLGNKAKALGVDCLYAVGEFSRLTVEAFGEGGKWFTDKNALTSELKNICAPNVVMLIKGSRGSRMEDVVEKLIKST